MTASDLYSITLSQLTATRNTMLSAQWQAALDGSTADQRLAASNELARVQSAILTLTNESLSDIAAGLQKNDAALQSSITALQATLKNLTKVQDVIQGVASVLSVVAKVIPLL